MIDVKDIIEKYRLEIDNFLKVDEMNIKERQLQLPSMKHLWAHRYIEAKFQLKKMENEKKKEKKIIVKQLNESATTVLSKMTLEKAAEEHTTIKKINEQIYFQEILIQYLEKIDIILKNMTYDIKNIIDLMQLETT